MLYKTKAVILHTIKYADNSAVLQAYTEEAGTQSFLLRHLTDKRTRQLFPLLGHLSLVEIVAYESRTGLHTIKEIHALHRFRTLQHNVVKQTILIFLNEVVKKTLQKMDADAPLFFFIEQSICQLDAEEDNYQNFHLYFLLHYARYLGFAPTDDYSEARPIFNLKEGRFLEATANNYLFSLSESQSYIVSLLLKGESVKSQITKSLRVEMLDSLLLFYNVHLPDFGKMQSLEILHTVFG